MDRDRATTERLNNFFTQIISLTRDGKIHWERQIGSAHRYARWKNNLLILGPSAPLTDKTPRYLFVTPFDSPACVEINSDDQDFGPRLMELVNQVEQTSKDEPPTDPFAMDDELLTRLE